jgi:transposase
LLALVKDRNAPQKHVWRAEIVLLSAGGAGTNAIMRQTGKSKTCVWRWQERFATEGFEACCVTRRGLPASDRWAMKSPHGLSP